MKNFIKSLLVLYFLLGSVVGFVHAESTDINLNIRDGSNMVFTGIIPLPGAGNLDINDSNGVPHSVNTQSVLAVVYGADLADDTWSMSNLTFFDSFGSFYVKCINYSGGEKCDSWQYVVDGTSPYSSIDQYVLSGGEQVYLYFGYPHQVVLSASSIEVNQSFQATAQNYDYQNDVWEPLTGVMLGATQPNPSDAFNPIEISTQAVDGSGVANFTLTTEGTYNVGIKEDFYFPTVPISVIAASGGSGGGGGGGGSSGGGGTSSNASSDNLPEFDAIDALKFLKKEANEDGSFGKSDLYTDWAAIAYGASNTKDEPYDKIVSYLSSVTTPGELLTDNERRAMALLSLKQNPYSFGGINYIELIVKDFDSVQFGEPDLVNDDVFALIVLPSVGYTIDDEIISKDIKFILSEQKTNGSWEGSVDLTAAAVQALKPFDELKEVSDSVLLASKYLKSAQKEDGGWGSVYSTSWVLQAEEALGESWKKNGKSGVNYLGLYQESDGGLLSNKDKDENRIWATSYAIPGALGKPWSEILHPVPKQDLKIDKKSVALALALTNVVPVVREIAAPTVTSGPKVLGVAIEELKEEKPVKEEPAENTLQTASIVNSSTPISTTVLVFAFVFGLGVGLGLGLLLRRLKIA